jgi:hypothetical protein
MCTESPGARIDRRDDVERPKYTEKEKNIFDHVLFCIRLLPTTIRLFWLQNKNIHLVRPNSDSNTLDRPPRVPILLIVIPRQRYNNSNKSFRPIVASQLPHSRNRNPRTQENRPSRSFQNRSQDMHQNPHPQKKRHAFARKGRKRRLTFPPNPGSITKQYNQKRPHPNKKRKKNKKKERIPPARVGRNHK